MFPLGYSIETSNLSCTEFFFFFNNKTRPLLGIPGISAHPTAKAKNLRVSWHFPFHQPPNLIKHQVLLILAQQYLSKNPLIISPNATSFTLLIFILDNSVRQMYIIMVGNLESGARLTAFKIQLCILPVIQPCKTLKISILLQSKNGGGEQITS